ncbi:MAG: hypothetical protein ACRCWB_04040 [Enterovibrio sp.]
MQAHGFIGKRDLKRNENTVGRTELSMDLQAQIPIPALAVQQLTQVAPARNIALELCTLMAKEG